MNINFMNLVTNFHYLVEGMLSIFIVMAVIVILTTLLNKMK